MSNQILFSNLDVGVAMIPKAAYLSKVKITQLDSLPNNTALSIKEKPFYN